MNRSLIFGEVLFDRFPDGSEVLGGAPFNVAWNLQGLGFNPLLISAVGDDDLGRKVLAAMESWGMNRDGVQVKGSLGTGIVNVSLKNGEPDFDIVADRAWDEISALNLPAISDIDLLYHGTLALRQPASSHTLEELRGSVRAPILVDINLRPPWWNLEQVLATMATVQQVKMNEAELLALTPDRENLESRAMELFERYRLDLLCVTRGASGAVAYTATGSIPVAPPEKNTEVRDTVGAGDAFTAVLIAGHLGSWPLATTLGRARELAGAVVGLRGAVTQDPEFYNRILEKWSLS
jgi:fructokinase